MTWYNRLTNGSPNAKSIPAKRKPYRCASCGNGLNKRYHKCRYCGRKGTVAKIAAKEEP